MVSGDAKFFTSTSKGEIGEWREELRKNDQNTQIEVLKKVIAAMTVGKDVSVLFAEVLNCMQTEHIGLKKLVYLYLINYAKSQPDLVILAVNTFVKDSQDPNPLVRALAVRTMGCIRVNEITEYLCDPLFEALQDTEAYVRKTAAVCVAKLFNINPTLVIDRGFISQLQLLLSDSNPMVVANSVAALSEIKEKNCDFVENMNSEILFKLLSALDDCTEWGQVFILNAIASYQTEEEEEIIQVLHRITPRLQHANHAVVLSAVQVIINQLEMTFDSKLRSVNILKIIPPLITLLNSEQEIQYVALRNIRLIIQRFPDILKEQVQVFFCKYLDPCYVKEEKLDIIVSLVCEQNIEKILNELKEYATEIDIEFVRHSIRAIGQCAISIETTASLCVEKLIELLNTRVNYIVQEVVIVMRDIFRKYPNRYEGIIKTVCDCLENLDDPTAKSAMIWIIGEYAERIDNSEELLSIFFDTFTEESSIVQLQLLTSVVKIFLKCPSPISHSNMERLLSVASFETDDPDIRDRAFVYWRLLSSKSESAHEIILCKKPVIQCQSKLYDKKILDELLHQLSMINSIQCK
jgi:AP-1 complex subunit beta-1